MDRELVASLAVALRLGGTASRKRQTTEEKIKEAKKLVNRGVSQRALSSTLQYPCPLVQHN